MTAALLVGDNAVHDFDGKASHIEAALAGPAEVRRTSDVSVLEELAGYDVVVDYLTDSTLTVGQLDGLCAFVADGGGYLGIHCAADLTSYVDGGELAARDEPVPALRELIGGHFVGHPPPATFGVEIVDRDHPDTAGVPSFEVFDEPYRLDADEDRLRVLARMDHPDLEVRYPVVWVRGYGRGRVCYSSLGHTDGALEHRAHRRLLANALRWVAAADDRPT